MFFFPRQLPMARATLSTTTAQNATLGVPHIASAAVKPTAAAKPTSAAATPTATTDTYSVVC